MSTVYASPIWLGRPHCPVTVTTGAGAVVTAALGIAPAFVLGA